MKRRRVKWIAISVLLVLSLWIIWQKQRDSRHHVSTVRRGVKAMDAAPAASSAVSKAMISSLTAADKKTQIFSDDYASQSQSREEIRSALGYYLGAMLQLANADTYMTVQASLQTTLDRITISTNYYKKQDGKQGLCRSDTYYIKITTGKPENATFVELTNDKGHWLYFQGGPTADVAYNLTDDPSSNAAFPNSLAALAKLDLENITDYSIYSSGSSSLRSQRFNVLTVDYTSRARAYLAANANNPINLAAIPVIIQTASDIDSGAIAAGRTLNIYHKVLTEYRYILVKIGIPIDDSFFYAPANRTVAIVRNRVEAFQVSSAVYIQGLAPST